MKPVLSLMGFAVVCFLVVVVLGGCAQTTYVPVATEFGAHKAPKECSEIESSPADLPFLTLPAGDVTMLSLAAGVAVTHRTNRAIYRELRRDARICARYVLRQRRAKA